MLPLVRKPDKKYFKMFLSAVIDGRKDYARPAMSLADGKKGRRVLLTNGTTIQE